jgi:glutaredoxin 2
LQRPRYVATGLLPEFQQLDSRYAFINNHEIGDYTKDVWKKSETISSSTKVQLYAQFLAVDPTTDIEYVNTKLIELDNMLASSYYCSETSATGTVTTGSNISYDDIDLFSRLRSISMIKNIIWPTKLRTYMDYMSELTDVPLYDTMAM